METQCLNCNNKVGNNIFMVCDDCFAAFPGYPRREKVIGSGVIHSCSPKRDDVVKLLSTLSRYTHSWCSECRDKKDTICDGCLILKDKELIREVSDKLI
jgi:hypothetical protein